MDPYVGQIQVFGFNFPPRYWAFCNGAELSISQYSAVYALLGTIYGGNGKTTFMLPNFAARGACNQGSGPGLTPRQIGSSFGEDYVTLNIGEMPAHSHGFTVYNQDDDNKRTSAPENGSSLTFPRSSSPYADPSTVVPFSSQMVGLSGGNQPHENRQPYLALNFCIALAGVFPSFD